MIKCLPQNNYLKDWKFPCDSISEGKKISIANLLSHKGGVSVGGFVGYAKRKNLPNTIEILDGLKPSNSDVVRSIFEPGSKLLYSVGRITSTQLILENATGQNMKII